MKRLVSMLLILPYLFVLGCYIVDEVPTIGEQIEDSADEIASLNVASISISDNGNLLVTHVDFTETINNAIENNQLIIFDASGNLDLQSVNLETANELFVQHLTPQQIVQFSGTLAQLLQNGVVVYLVVV